MKIKIDIAIKLLGLALLGTTHSLQAVESREPQETVNKRYGVMYEVVQNIGPEVIENMEKAWNNIRESKENKQYKKEYEEHAQHFIYWLFSGVICEMACEKSMCHRLYNAASPEEIQKMGLQCINRETLVPILEEEMKKKQWNTKDRTYLNEDELLEKKNGATQHCISLLVNIFFLEPEKAKLLINHFLSRQWSQNYLNQCAPLFKTLTNVCQLVSTEPDGWNGDQMSKKDCIKKATLIQQFHNLKKEKTKGQEGLKTLIDLAQLAIQYYRFNPQDVVDLEKFKQFTITEADHHNSIFIIQALILIAAKTPKKETLFVVIQKMKNEEKDASTYGALTHRYTIDYDYFLSFAYQMAMNAIGKEIQELKGHDPFRRL